MKEQRNNERPEVYALHQENEAWQISRRDFLKAAGIGAAAVSVGLNSMLIKPASAEEDLAELCKEALSHEDPIKNIIASADGKYLISYDGSTLKCWRFDNYSMVAERSLTNISSIATGFVDGKSCVICKNTLDAEIMAMELPDMKTASDRKIDITWIGADLVRGISSGNSGDLYVSRLNQTQGSHKHYSITRIKNGGTGSYTETENLYYSEEEFLSFAVFDDERKLLLLTKDRKFRIIDPSDKSEKDIDMPALSSDNVYTIVPGDAFVLYSEGSASAAYRMISLAYGTALWAKELPQTDAIEKTAVSPDGSLGILLSSGSKGILSLISMSDGSVIRQKEMGGKFDSCKMIAVAGDGSKFAAAVNKSLFFISLPDMNIIGCPIDLSKTKDNKKGIEISYTDSVTGEKVTYTLPCGAAIPAGAVCVCNCVAGKVPSCSCVGNTCSCVGNKCSCVGHGGHYWHPN